MKNKLPTAEELFSIRELHGSVTKDEIVDTMIEFAKLHCKRQAEVIAEKAKTTGGNMLMFGALHVRVDKDSILNAYNLEEEIK